MYRLHTGDCGRGQPATNKIIINVAKILFMFFLPASVLGELMPVRMAGPDRSIHANSYDKCFQRCYLYFPSALVVQLEDAFAGRLRIEAEYLIGKGAKHILPCF